MFETDPCDEWSEEEIVLHYQSVREASLLEKLYHSFVTLDEFRELVIFKISRSSEKERN